MLQQIPTIVVDGMLLGLIYAILGLGLSLVLGIMGIVNVAHSAFIMLGSFFAFELFRRMGVDPIVAFFLSFPVFFVLGALVYRVLITRVERAAQTQGLVAMFGLMVLIENLGTIAWTTDTRVITAPYTNASLMVGNVTLVHVKLIAGLLALLLIAGFWALLRFTLVGRAIRAMGQNRDGGDHGRRQRRPALGDHVRARHRVRGSRRRRARNDLPVLAEHTGAVARLGVPGRDPRRPRQRCEHARRRASWSA